MFLNSFLKITTKKSDDRYLQTDNLDTYFIISDFKSPSDGLWFNGFQIFNSITIENAKNIESKTLTPDNIQVMFSNKFLLNFSLLKKGNGFIIEVNNKKFMPKPYKNYIIDFNLNEKFLISEKNIKNIILEYSNPKNKSSDYKKIYCAIAINIDYDFDNVKQTKDGITFSLKSLEKTTKEPEFYIFYHNKYDEIKNILENNTNNINSLKQDHLNNSLLPLKFIKLQTDDKIINKALFWSIISSSNFISNKNKIYGILSGIPNNLEYQTINIFISLTGTTLVPGLFKKARDIIYNISKFQCSNQSSKDYGKIPDFIVSSKKSNYILDDSTPLFIRAIYEYYLYTGDNKLVNSLWDKIKLSIDKVYFSNKDKNNFLIQSTNSNLLNLEKYDSYLYLPRGDKSVETQALWYTSLYCASFIAKKIASRINRQNNKDNKIQEELLNLSKKYKEEAKKLKESFIKYFISKDTPYVYDHLNIDFSTDKAISIYPILALFYSSLPGIPQLIDKTTVLNLIKLLILNFIYKVNGESSKFFDKIIKLWLYNILISTACRYGLYNLVFKYTKIIAKQILEKDTLGTLSEYYTDYLKNEKKIRTSENFSYSSSISEFSRSFYQDYLGIKMNIAERKIYISPSIPVELNKINTSIRFGFKESILYYIRLSKKSSNISYIEIKGLKILKPISIFLKLNLGFEQIKDKYKYYQLIIKFKFNNSDDIIRISFESINQYLIKLKDISTIGTSIIYGLNYKSEIYDECIEGELKSEK